jgi:hypothetical protein
MSNDKLVREWDLISNTELWKLYDEALRKRVQYWVDKMKTTRVTPETMATTGDAQSRINEIETYILTLPTTIIRREDETKED